MGGIAPFLTGFYVERGMREVGGTLEMVILKRAWIRKPRSTEVVVFLLEPSINLRVEIGYLLSVSRIMQYAVRYPSMPTVVRQTLTGAILLPDTQSTSSAVESFKLPSTS